VLLGASACAGRAAIEVSHVWARPTPPGISVGVVYLQLSAVGQRDRLVAIESTVAERVEIHETNSAAGTMRMRRVPELVLERDQPVVLGPGGMHLMLVDLKEPLVAGAHFTLTMTFEHAGRIAVEVSVELQEPSD
jgi:copper(I)-binding protein